MMAVESVLMNPGSAARKDEQSLQAQHEERGCRTSRTAPISRITEDANYAGILTSLNLQPPKRREATGLPSITNEAAEICRGTTHPA
jgi:hypothetical protein